MSNLIDGRTAKAIKEHVEKLGLIADIKIYDREIRDEWQGLTIIEIYEHSILDDEPAGWFIVDEDGNYKWYRIYAGENNKNIGSDLKQVKNYLNSIVTEIKR